MEINNDLIEMILNAMKEAEPNKIPQEQFGELLKIASDDNTFMAHIEYLDNHGLITSSLPGMHYILDMELTARGRDYLMSNGGISAKLNTITINVHDEALTRIESFIKQSILDRDEQSGLLSQLKSLPANAIKHLLLKTVDLGLENVPEVLRLIRNTLGKTF